MRTSVRHVVPVSVGLLLFCGCSSNQNTSVVPIVPVKGTIIYRGKPLTKGQIMFEPVDAGRDAYGTIGPDGTFVMSTFKQGDGAVRGVHKVSVTGVGRNVRTKGETEVEVIDGKGDYKIDLK